MAAQPRGDSSARSQRVTIPIYGLACGGGGALAVERALERTPGVLRVYVNPLTEMAYVDFDASRTDPSQLSQTIERVGLRAGDAVRV